MKCFGASTRSAQRAFSTRISRNRLLAHAHFSCLEPTQFQSAVADLLAQLHTA